MQNAIKLENISSLITPPSSYQCRRTSKLQINSMQTNNYALVDHIRTLTDFKSDTTIITDLNSI